MNIHYRYSLLLTELATTYQSGVNCSFALHDALAEAGFPNVAKLHFSDCRDCGPCNPQDRCSAIAAILGRTIEGFDFTISLEELEQRAEEEILTRGRNGNQIN